jgi:hypothetical protein
MVGFLRGYVRVFVLCKLLTRKYFGSKSKG